MGVRLTGKKLSSRGAEERRDSSGGAEERRSEAKKSRRQARNFVRGGGTAARDEVAVTNAPRTRAGGEWREDESRRRGQAHAGGPGNEEKLPCQSERLAWRRQRASAKRLY